MDEAAAKNENHGATRLRALAIGKAPIQPTPRTDNGATAALDAGDSGAADTPLT